MTFANMTAFADRIDRITSALGRTVAWLALVVVLLQFALVIVRYLFGLGSVWLTETVVYAHATVFMLAAAWTLQVGGHVRVDIFYADASARTKALIEASVGQMLDAQLRRETESFAACAATEEFVEGVRAFLEKRRPDFR